ncbi:hypothetical protein STXM2123_2931 [Streptomyces sp. F-3]|nr:hypothetical protein STXM2123_2931 [Streptomyces sp. F-3]
MAFDKGPARRKLSTRRIALQLLSQLPGELVDAATLLHESTE